MSQSFVNPDQIRAWFSRAMSDMYKLEVPLYDTLLDLVAQVNAKTMAEQPELAAQLARTGEIERLDIERHGAIRVGTPEELANMRRVFAVMGMQPVGYYDLSPAGVPVHSTAFRATHETALQASPFRVFTSLLRLELIDDVAVREKAARILAARRIFTDRVLELTACFEAQGGLNDADAQEFVAEALHTFRWHSESTVSLDDYRELHGLHRLIADVVAFKGPHINHLTPRTLDIDEAQAEMPRRGVSAKAVIEGPPPRKCPILLRQTSFKALEEPVRFAGPDGGSSVGSHTARFGEIEQRGVALTRKGRALYDQLLDLARSRISGAPNEGNAAAYMQNLQECFAAFPDDYAQLHGQGLAYFRYFLTGKEGAADASDLSSLIEQGYIQFEPLVYEDFLPVSAAGIFQSNLGDKAQAEYAQNASQTAFEQALGAPVKDELALYEDTQARSLAACMQALREQAGSPVAA
ncbi:VOC family protein [Achromobacter deleyi]|uniref:2-oxoadipate dioxygenase/decarboxylase HglS n=1 Tax=Achromobacter deleyi TaxID=1353891 RepID=UPI001493053E|nr:VOC family protein [Achromobacter deleyi]QVQ24434.1 VOC family protein [Achromobacter deleyi]UIP19968.1 VOC family protein [Achromobacter deleyi]